MHQWNSENDYVENILFITVEPNHIGVKTTLLRWIIDLLKTLKKNYNDKTLKNILYIFQYNFLMILNYEKMLNLTKWWA